MRRSGTGENTGSTSGEAPYRYGVAAAAVLAGVVLRLALLHSLGMRVAFITFYPAVMLAALYGGLRAGLVATVLSAVIAESFWVKPGGSGLGGAADWVALGVFVVSCAMMSGIAEAMQRARAKAAVAEEETRTARERARVAEALRESDDRFRLLFENALDGMFLGTPDGKVIAANPAACAMFGMSEEELCRLGRAGLMNPADARHAATLDQRARTGRADAELTFVRKDGTTFVAELQSVVVGKEQERSFVVLRDITDRRRAEEELKAAKLGAEQAKAAAEDASSAKDHFLAVLSHELRNPLNPVLATASMLRADERFDADTREQLEVICRNAELEARLIDDLLDVTRIEKGKIVLDRRHVDLSTIIARAAEVCMPDIQARKLEFGVDGGPGPYWVDADAARLQQVFWNLIKNAVKFTPLGGCVGVRCRRDDAQFVVAEVSDSGAGIEADALGRIFKAFEQADRTVTRQFGGLGLGLAISKALVDMHGGSIQAYSQGKGKGATFAVRLPLVQTPVEAGVGAAPPSPRSEGGKRKLRILLVEDHGDTARIMSRVLSAEGHQVDMAADVATALKLGEEKAFDLLLSDLGLPDGSGLDLMQALRGKGIKLPAIALSGYGLEEDVRQSREAGYLAHLTKPVQLATLVEEISRAVAG